MFWNGKTSGTAAKVDRPSRRLAILGAGPIGMEAALQGLDAGYRVTVYDRGEVGDHLRQWGHVKLFSPFGLNATAAGIAAIAREHRDHQLPGPNEFTTGHVFRDAYLTPLSMTAALDSALKLKTEVLGISRGEGRGPFRILVREAGTTERIDEADIVFDCTGTYGRHPWAGPGVPAVNERAAEGQIAYGLEDVLGTRRAYYAGRSILLIGNGYSAATTVCNLATLAEEHSATWVFWLTAAGKTAPLPRIANDPFRERDRLAARANSLAARGEGNLEYHAQSRIDEITSHGPDKGFRVLARCAGRDMVWEVDRVIANVGYRADTSLYGELPLGVLDAGSSPRPTDENFFVLGAKAAPRDRGFLLKEGYERVERAFAELAAR